MDFMSRVLFIEFTDEQGRTVRRPGPAAAQACGRSAEETAGPALAQAAAPREAPRMSAGQREEGEIGRLQRELAAAKALTAEKDAEMQRMAAVLSKRGTTLHVTEQSSQHTSAPAPPLHHSQSSLPGSFPFPALRCPRMMSSLKRAAFRSRQVLVPLGKRRLRACGA